MCFILRSPGYSSSVLESFKIFFRSRHLSFKFVSQKHADKIAFMCVFLIPSSLFVKQGIGLFFATHSKKGGRARKPACYWVPTVDLSSSHMLSCYLAPVRGRVCCHFPDR